MKYFFAIELLLEILSKMFRVEKTINVMEDDSLSFD